MDRRWCAIFIAILAATISSAKSFAQPSPVGSNEISAALKKLPELVVWLKASKSNTSDANAEAAMDICIRVFSNTAKLWLLNSQRSLKVGKVREARLSLASAITEETACISNIKDITPAEPALAKELNSRINVDALQPLNQAYSKVDSICNNC